MDYVLHLRSIDAEQPPGAKLIASKIDLKSSIANTDLVITSEGKIDHQTLNGKKPIYVSQLAREFEKPIILISDCVENGNEELTNDLRVFFYFKCTNFLKRSNESCRRIIT